MTARVAWISLTPVKGLALEHVEQVELLESGLRGDRRFYLVDRKNRLVNNKGRRRCALEVVHSRFDEDANELTLRFADDREISGATEPGEELQTVFHKRPKTARAVAGPWDDALSEVVQEPVRLVVAKSRARRSRPRPTALSDELRRRRHRSSRGRRVGREAPLDR
jgi:uncharacterized protein YcbX